VVTTPKTRWLRKENRLPAVPELRPALRSPRRTTSKIITINGVPVAEEKEDVPNGMVMQSVWGPLHMDADPDAPDLTNTGLLSWSGEVSLGWLRTTFPQMWEKFEAGQMGGAPQLTRWTANIATWSPRHPGYSTWSNFSSQNNRPTRARGFSQCFSLKWTKSADELQKDLPKGCEICFVADMPLMLREPSLPTSGRTAAPSRKALDYTRIPSEIQQSRSRRINDCISKIDEYMDRLACGILLANEKYIDSKAMNGKQMLPGLLNPVTMKANTPNVDLAHLIFQVKAEIDAQIFTYLAVLKQDMELLVSLRLRPSALEHSKGVETMGGQRQQLDTGMMKMGLVWDNVREEHAESAENGVKCAGKNMTEDWKSVVTDETQEFRNEYVHLDQMKGSVHAEPETDQGFPMTWADIRAFYQELFEKGGEILDYLMQEPENIDNALRYIAIPWPQSAWREHARPPADHHQPACPVRTNGESGSSDRHAHGNAQRAAH
jgi:hypothetical protein